jgi:beta-glucosidase
MSVLDGIHNKITGRDLTVRSAKGCNIGGKVLNPVTPEFLFLPDAATRNGVRGQYYNNKELQGEPVLSRIDKNIEFFWSDGVPDPAVNADGFSVRWTCRLVPPETRTYRIGTRADNGTRLYLDGKLLMDNWSDPGLRRHAQTVDLVGGRSYDMVLEYYENTGRATAQLQWDHHMTFYEDAVAVAKKSDMAIVCVGTTPEVSSEGNDRDDIDLPAVQQQLVEKILEVNKHTVVVLINGGPVAWGPSVQKAPAILEAWYAGQAQGQAVADALFGDINPGGRLPQTFYASSEQLGDFADYDVIHGHKTYQYFEGQPLYAFGHGLSYTTFRYANLSLNPKTADPNGHIEILFEVTNTGQRAGDEVVQVYGRDVQASVKVPRQRLLRFQRISLNPGQTRQVSFTFAVSELGFYRVQSNTFQVEPGTFEILVGSSSADIRLTESILVE